MEVIEVEGGDDMFVQIIDERLLIPLVDRIYHASVPFAQIIRREDLWFCIRLDVLDAGSQDFPHAVQKVVATHFEKIFMEIQIGFSRLEYQPVIAIGIGLLRKVQEYFCIRWCQFVETKVCHTNFEYTAGIQDVLDIVGGDLGDIGTLEWIHGQQPLIGQLREGLPYGGYAYGQFSRNLGLDKPLSAGEGFVDNQLANSIADLVAYTLAFMNYIVRDVGHTYHPFGRV